jgi:hypothetical protein
MKEELSTPDRIVYAFRSIACRQPKSQELAILLKYFDEEKEKFAGASQKAKEFIRAGEYPHEGIQDVQSLAALMQVIHTIYNMEESITKV